MKQANITAWTTPSLYNFTTPILNFPVTFAYVIGKSRLFLRIVTFWLLRLSYLLTDQFLVDNYLCKFYGIISPRLVKIFVTRPRMLLRYSCESLRQIRRILAWPLKSGVGVVQGHWKWRRKNPGLINTNVSSSTVEQKRSFEINEQTHGRPWQTDHQRRTQRSWWNIHEHGRLADGRCRGRVPVL